MRVGRGVAGGDEANRHLSPMMGRKGAVPAARNAFTVREPVVYRDQGWLLLWAGTTWNEVGRGTGGVDIFYPEGYASWSSAERTAFFEREFSAFVRERPAQYLGLMLKKALWFWLPFYPEWSSVHKIWAGTYFGGLYVLALVGAFRR